MKNPDLPNYKRQITYKDYVKRNRANGNFIASNVKTVSKDAVVGPRASIAEEVAAGRERQLPSDYKKYVTPDQPIFRGETRFVPEHLANNPQEIVNHLFGNSSLEIGKSWSLREEVADSFANPNSMTKFNLTQPEGTVPVDFIMHSQLNPRKMSFDNGTLKGRGGEPYRWDDKNWRERIRHKSRSAGVYNEAEVLMKHDSEIPVHRVDIKHNGKLNSFQFDPPANTTTNISYMSDVTGL
jgi:hypothetical protein